MGNSGSTGKKHSRHEINVKNGISNKESCLSDFVPPVNHLSRNHFTHFQSPKATDKSSNQRLQRSSLNENSHNDEKTESKESEDKPPLTGHSKPQQTATEETIQNCLQIDVCLFKKVISFKEELSLLDDLNEAKQDMIENAMTGFTTKTSCRFDEDYDEDQDILSVYELQNTIPFIFNDSSRNVCSPVFSKNEFKTRKSV